MKLTLEELELIQNTLEERENSIRRLPSFVFGIAETREELSRVENTLEKVRCEVIDMVMEKHAQPWKPEIGKPAAHSSGYMVTITSFPVEGMAFVLKEDGSKALVNTKFLSKPSN